MQKLWVRVISIVLFTALVLGGLSIDASARPLGALSPGLGDAESFSVLAHTAITNVPVSSISGDVGLSPAAGSNYAGLTDPEVGGTIYAVDIFGPAGSVADANLLTDAKDDASAAFDTLDQNCTTDYGNIVYDLVDHNLGPGVYCAGAFELSGTLTLTGSGVWIFKSASTLITSGAANVVGGNALDVWWRVVSAASLGTDTEMVGTIIANISIGLATNATLNGRAMALTGAVTLDQNTIYGPICLEKTATAEAKATATAAAKATATAAAALTATANAPVEEEEEEDTPTATATLLPVMTALPGTGGAPIRSDSPPWGLLVVAGFSIIILVFGVRAYRSTDRHKR